MKASQLTRVGLLLAILIVSAQFALPIGPIAISLQTLVILIIGLILPSKEALLTTSLYLIIGLLGMPVFAQARGGPQSILYPSFGFVLSFIPAVWLIARISAHYQNKGSKKSDWLAVLAGNIVIYLIGLTYMATILHFHLNLSLTVGKILSLGFLPFIPADIIKTVLAVTIAKRIKKNVRIDNDDIQ